jgi:peptide/nickel transport system substrate-binding protein
MIRQRYTFIAIWLIASLLLAACTAPAAAPAAESDEAAPAAETPAAAEESSAATTPAEGGILNFAYAQLPRNLNPLDSVQGVQSQLFRMIYNRLLQYDIGFFGSPPQPSLAESYEVSEDGLTFTFRLRQDVVWHDGEPFTAEDVAFTYTAAVHPDNPTFWGPSLSTLKGLSAFQDGTAESIEGLNIVDEYTIQITLEAPSMSFLDTLAFVGILPEHILGEVPAAELVENEFFINSPIGTGPFKVVEVAEDQYIRLERHDAYFLGAPKLAGINFIFPDSTTVAAGFETGEIDLSSSLPTEDIERFLDNPDYTVVFQPSSVFCNVTANVERLPKNIRHAIQFAIDRETITDVLFLNSQLSKPFYHHLGQEFLQPNPFEKEITYDPDQARALVQQSIDAGEWEADHVLDYIFSGEEPSEEILFIQQFLADVGLNSELRGVGDRAAFNQVYLEEHDFDIVSGCNAYGPEPDSANIYYKCGYGAEEGGYNASLFCNERADELLEAGRAETNLEARIPIYQELQGILDDEAAIIPIRLSVTSWVMTSRLKDATPQYYGHLTNYDAIETWYLEE